MCYDSGELSRHCDQKCLFTFVKPAYFSLLYDEHTQDFPLMDNGGTQKRVIALLTQAGHELKAGVGFGIFQVKRLLTRGYQAHQTLARGERGLANLFGI